MSGAALSLCRFCGGHLEVTRTPVEDMFAAWEILRRCRRCDRLVSVSYEGVTPEKMTLAYEALLERQEGPQAVAAYREAQLQPLRPWKDWEK